MSIFGLKSKQNVYVMKISTVRSQAAVAGREVSRRRDSSSSSYRAMLWNGPALARRPHTDTTRNENVASRISLSYGTTQRFSHQKPSYVDSHTTISLSTSTIELFAIAWTPVNPSIRVILAVPTNCLGAARRYCILVHIHAMSCVCGLPDEKDFFFFYNVSFIRSVNSTELRLYRS